MLNLIDFLINNDIPYTVSDNGAITVGDSLDLSYTRITALPGNLTVGGWLDLQGTRITTLPDNLNVGGSLWLNAEKIKNVAWRKNCGDSGRTIFAMWNGQFRIAAGCFFGTVDEFEQAVDQKYKGDAAEAYKQAARDCVAELDGKIN